MKRMNFCVRYNASGFHAFPRKNYVRSSSVRSVRCRGYVCLFRSICRHFLTSSHYILATSTNTFNCWNMYSDFFVLIDNWYMVDGN
jgi:hypothetical protein